MAVPSPAFLDESAYGQFTAWPTSRGWNSSTHLARINFGHGDENAYVKLIFTDAFPALANEAIGWQLAHACNIPAASRAAIMIGSAEFWRETLGSLPSGCPTTGDIPAWCIASCATLDQHTWINMDNDAAVTMLLKCPRGQQIAAFGTWLHHPDQHPGNLLRIGSNDWAIIDHELLFNGVLGNWRKPPARRDFSTPPFLLKHLDSLVARSRISHKVDSDIRSAMIHYASQHITAIGKAMPYLADVLEKVEPPATAKSVLPLIVDRAWNFWMPSTVNKLA